MGLKGQVSQAPRDGEFFAVSAGTQHGCAIKNDRRAVCWGDNSFDQSSPATAGQWFSVAAGDRHSCGIKIDNTVTCWGDGPGAQNTPSDQFLTMDAGWNHNCGVRIDNTLKCWGGNVSEQSRVPSTLNQTRFLSVDAGEKHNCAITVGGLANCWGFRPGHLPGIEFTVVSAGKYHSSGIKIDDTIACSTGFSMINSPSGKFLTVAVGETHNCAIKKTDGTVACWELHLSRRSLPPTDLQARTNSEFLWLTEKSVSLDRVVQLQPTAGTVHSAGRIVPENSFVSVLVRPAVVPAGSVYVRADLDRTDKATLSPSSFVLTAASSGAELVLSVPEDSGDLQTDAVPLNVTFSSEPPSYFKPSTLHYVIPPNDLDVSLVAPVKPGIGDMQMLTIHVDNLQAAKSFIISSTDSRIVVPGGIVTTAQDSFSVAVGLNADAVIDGAETLPLKLHALDALKPLARNSAQLAVGNDHNCVIQTDNRAACWAGRGVPSIILPQESALAPFLAITAGDSDSCAIQTNNRVMCWVGRNGDPGSLPNDLVSARFLTLSSQGLRNCGIQVGDTVACWTSGQDPLVLHRNVKQARFQTVDSGDSHSCGVQTDNKALCWSNDNGDPVSYTHLTLPTNREV